jgi:hypothetical protein
MTGVYSVLGFAAELKAIDHDLESLGPKIVERACQIIMRLHDPEPLGAARTSCGRRSRLSGGGTGPLSHAATQKGPLDLFKRDQPFSVLP